MVCNTTQSAFYRVIAEYNESCAQEEKNRSENSAKTCKKMYENPCEKNREKLPKKTEKKCGKNICENRCEKCPKKSTEDCPKNHRKNCQKNYDPSFGKKTCDFNRGNQITDIFSDSDLLLICALIYILYKNGADQKIILALVFVLIS
ncbi:MAG: hypothetical protein J1F03_01850 [Oscillospiraceae bacterium]|nr:hypothetical protein [Oscillospiraceae bacterium]